MMIKHFVFFKVKPMVSEEAIDNAFAQLSALKSKIPGIINITYGNCRFHARKGEGYITHGFSIDFDNENAYEIFLNDPVTYSAKGCIINIAVNGFEGIFGFDIGKEHNAYPNPLDKYRVPTPRLVPPGSTR